MPEYHSTMATDHAKFIGNIPILPLKNTAKSGGIKSSAPVCKPTEMDIVDESLDLFKANIFFSSFEINEKADLVMIYCILYISG